MHRRSGYQKSSAWEQQDSYAILRISKNREKRENPRPMENDHPQTQTSEIR
jgi:hypothetical protein